MIQGTVLVIDDDEDLSEAVGENIQRLGLDVTIVTSALESLQHLESTLYSCIVIDLNLGDEDLNGQVLVKSIRSEPAYALNQATPIILFSGYIDLDVLQDLKPYVSDAITKPFDPKLLMQKIIKYTKAQQTAG